MAEIIALLAAMVAFFLVLLWTLALFTYGPKLVAASRRRAAIANAQALQRQMEAERGKPRPTGGRLIRGDRDPGAPAEPDLAQPYRELARKVVALEQGQRLLWQQLEAIKQSLPPNQ